MLAAPELATVKITMTGKNILQILFTLYILSEILHLVVDLPNKLSLARLSEKISESDPKTVTFKK